jgi:hypothetical protein
MERRSKTLQQMFDDAQEVEDNLQACQRLQNQNLESVANTENDGVAEEHEIVHKQEVDLHPDLFQHEQKNDCSMHFFEVFNDDIVAEDKDQPTEEKVDVPRFFLVDDIADVVDLPKYDEYNDNYEVDFSEQPVNVLQQEMFSFNSLRKAVSLHVSVVTTMKNMRKVLNQVKEILYPCAFLHSNY